MMNIYSLTSPILLRGDATHAFRDPTAVYHAGSFYLYYTYVLTEADSVYMYTAMSKSSDLLHWTPPRILTPKDRSLNFSSPGNIVSTADGWLMCLQTYPRQNGEKYANDGARIYSMFSRDLVHWNTPQLLRVKGENVPEEEMGRMIDPFLIRDKDDPSLWRCLYKQNGVSFSSSRDLQHWTYGGSTASGENVCVIVHDDVYYIFHSPQNGIGLMKTEDFVHFEPVGGLITLGQQDWEWALGRLTAGFVLETPPTLGLPRYLMFFHATGPEDESVIFDTHACIGIAWSENLTDWEYPCR